MTIDRCERFLEPCGDPIVIGADRHFTGPVEIVAYSSKFGTCVDIDHRRGGWNGGCGGSALPDRGPIDVSSGHAVDGGKRGYMELVGELAPSVARVKVHYKRKRGWRRAETLVAQVDGELLERLKAPEPFGVFLATLRGCKRGKQRFWLRAYDAGGNALGGPRSGRLRRLCFRGGETFFGGGIFVGGGPISPAPGG